MERRRFIRIQARYMLRHEKYSLKADQDRKAVAGVVKNYSGDGALFESKTKYDIGDILKLEIDIPGWDKFKTEFYKEKRTSASEPIVVLASVVRVEVMVPDDLYDIGVFFVGIDKGHQGALIKQINTRLNQ